MKKYFFAPLRSDIAWREPDVKLAPVLPGGVWPVVWLRIERAL